MRLVREEESNRCRLIICGPGTDIVTQEFANVAECMKRQGEIEQELVAGGYQLAQLSSDRRKEHGSWQEVGSTSSSELTCSAGEARPEHTTPDTLFGLTTSYNAPVGRIASATYP